MDGISIAANLISVINLSAKVIALCTKYAIQVKNAHDDRAQLLQEVIQLHAVSQKASCLWNDHGAQLDATSALCVPLQDSLLQLEQLSKRLVPVKSRTFAGRSYENLKWPLVTKEVGVAIQCLRRCIQAVDLSLQVDQTSILLSIDQKALLERLPIARGASFDSFDEQHNPLCLPNTRVDLLDQTSMWATSSNPDTKSLFWLNGAAGTGKSTISRTLSHSFAQTGILGATFFFKRGQSDRVSLAKFFTSLAAQLVERQKILAPFIKIALDRDPHIHEKASQEQFERLISGPLFRLNQRVSKRWDSQKSTPGCVVPSQDEPSSQDSKRHSKPTIVLVIDALDECGQDKDVRLLLQLLASIKPFSINCLQVRTFITSRPELPIRLGFNRISGSYEDLVLHELPLPVIERDIIAYYEHQLSNIRMEWNESSFPDHHLSPTWPCDAQRQLLVEIAIPLFVCAATICRFLGDRRLGSPEKNLAKIICEGSHSYRNQLDEVYSLILQQLIQDLARIEKDEFLTDFRDIVGSIIILANPLSTHALASILNLPKDTVDSRLDLLHAVLSVPSSPKSSVRLLHLSFREFLVDPQYHATNEFWIDEKATHFRMLQRCLQMMNERLHRNMCRFPRPETTRQELTANDIDMFIPPELQYACLFWVYHLQQAHEHVDDGRNENIDVFEFLKCHLLHWIETMCLMGKMVESISILDTLGEQIERHSDMERFLLDVKAIILLFTGTIVDAPLQLYTSGTIFAPEGSMIKGMMDKDTPDPGTLPPTTDSNSTTGQAYDVVSVSLDPDSKLILSGMFDGIARIWDNESGSCLQTISRGENVKKFTFAFSNGSPLGITAAPIKNEPADCGKQFLKAWNAATGQSYTRVKLNDPIPIEDVSMLSTHLQNIVSAVRDGAVQMWDFATGKSQKTFSGNITKSQLLVFSQNLRGFASTPAMFWDITTGQCHYTVENETSDFKMAAISRDANRLVFASQTVLTTWDTQTCECLHTVRVEEVPFRRLGIAFSHEARQLAVHSGGQDKVIDTWTGKCLYLLDGPS